MTEFTITANKDFDLRYVFDEIFDDGLGLEDGVIALSTKEGASPMHAGGDLPMLEIKIKFRREISSEERLKLHETLRKLVGSDANIDFKNG